MGAHKTEIILKSAVGFWFKQNLIGSAIAGANLVDSIGTLSKLLNLYILSGTIPMKKALVVMSALFVGLDVVAMATYFPSIANATPVIKISQTRQPLPPASATPALTFGLADGTPIKLKFKQTVSSKNAEKNDPIEFEVAEDVIISNAVVIAKGASAKGVVTDVKRSGMLGRKGKLEIAIKEVTLVSGERVALRGSKEGGGGTSGGIIAVAAIINPLALLFKGKNMTYEAGTEVGAFVDGDFALDRNKFSASPRRPF
ncbi:hypothetical protein ACKFKF_17550 [Phormidesmis sp. 146-12]